MSGKLPPGPREWFPWQNYFRLNADTLGFMTELARRYGGLAQFSLSGKPLYGVASPELVREVLQVQRHCFVKTRALDRTMPLFGDGLLFSDGELHVKQRRILQPCFDAGHVQRFAAAARAAALERSAAWRDGDRLHLQREAQHLILDVICRNLFGVPPGARLSGLRDEIAEVVKRLLMPAMPFTARLARMRLPGHRAFFESLGRIEAFVASAAEEGCKAGDETTMAWVLKRAFEKGDVSALQVRDELMTALIAGYESTTQVITWTWYALSQHPEVEARMHDELDRVLQGRVPEPADVSRLPYLRQVLNESLRVFPPVWILTRRSVAECTLGGYRLPAGSVFVMCPPILHHDPTHFPEPGRFDPDRWTPEEQRRRPEHSFIPFGAGSRRCIGESAALAEIVLSLAVWAQRWTLRLEPGPPVVAIAGAALTPSRALRVRLEERAAARRSARTAEAT